jgi:hypothetical protein
VGCCVDGCPPSFSYRSPAMEMASEPSALEPVYQALRLRLPQLRRSDRAAAELAAALEVCASDGDEEAGRLRADILSDEHAAA